MTATVPVAEIALPVPEVETVKASDELPELLIEKEATDPVVVLEFVKLNIVEVVFVVFENGTEKPFDAHPSVTVYGPVPVTDEAVST